MSIMFEVFYAAPPDGDREKRIVEVASEFGGACTLRELGGGTSGGSICLTIEFVDWKSANAAAAAITDIGEHVEGPQDYGDD